MAEWVEHDSNGMRFQWKGTIAPLDASWLRHRRGPESFVSLAACCWKVGPLR